MIIIALFVFASCKIFEPDNDPTSTDANIAKAATHDLFNIDDWNIYFDGAAPNYLEGYFVFDQDMNKSSFETNLYIYQITADNTLGNRVLNITFNWLNAREVQFRTAATYDDDVAYLIKVPAATRDANGHGPYGDYSGITVSYFTATDWTGQWDPGATGFAMDYTKPTAYIRAVLEGNNEWDDGDYGDVGTGEYFDIYFAEDVVPGDITSANISFTPSVSFSVSTQTANTRFRITPSSALNVNTDYVISLNMSNVEDVNGNAGSDDNNNDDDNYIQIRFNTYEYLVDTLRYGGYAWRDTDQIIQIWFDTPKTEDDYLDHSTINYNTVWLDDEEYVMWVEDDMIDLRTYIVIKGHDIDAEDYNFSYKITDTDGNTLDGNGNNRLEGDYRDDYHVYIP